MRNLLIGGLVAATCLVQAQGHGTPVQPSLRQMNFMLGDWHGVQKFNAALAGREMTADMELHAKRIIGGRYIEERIMAKLPNREPADVRHMTMFDAKTNTFQAWWFDDANVGPRPMSGGPQGKDLVLMSSPRPGAPVLRATYSPKTKDTFSFKLEMQMNGKWTQLFETNYERSKPADGE